MNIINEIGRISRDTGLNVSFIIGPDGRMSIYATNTETNKSEFIFIRSDLDKNFILAALRDTISRLRTEENKNGLH